MVTRGGEATTGFRPLWLIGGVDGGGVECVRCAGQPPLFKRGDEATTLSETVAARVHNIDEVINEEDLRLPGVGGCPEPAPPAATKPPLVVTGSATRLSCTTESCATIVDCG